jgi:UDP-glucose:(heptosyl)LPS alpha-1,3-glucosyltransferase
MHIYSRGDVQLAAVSEMVRAQLKSYFGRSDARCIRNGVNISQFSPTIRSQRRSEARNHLGIPAHLFIFLLIGNDWRKKGLEATIEAFGECNDLPIQLLVVGRDQIEPFSARIDELRLSEKIRFLPPSDDVMKFYAAADAYLGPSLEDAFGMPVLEAMACGLPVVASVTSGVSEIIENNWNGLLLHDPRSVGEFAALIRRLFSDSALLEMLTKNAARTAEDHTWDKSAAALWELLNQTLEGKQSCSAERR